MGKDEHHLDFHQRRQPNRRPRVVGEAQEARSVGDETAMQREAVEDRAHAVLPNSEMRRPSLTSGKVDSLKSPHPPNRFQPFFPIAASACEADTRVASESLGVKTGSSASHPLGRSFASAAWNSAAAAECFLEYA